MRERFKNWLSIRLWRILRHSRIFGYWYKEHLTELLLEMERFDLEGDIITAKYARKLNEAKARRWY